MLIADEVVLAKYLVTVLGEERLRDGDGGGGDIKRNLPFFVLFCETHSAFTPDRKSVV